MALNSLFCADVPLSNYSLTHCSRVSCSNTEQAVNIFYTFNVSIKI